jgi:hypothetical protein
MANKFMKKCSTSLAIKEMQIKTVLRFLSHPSQNSYHQENKAANAGEDRGRWEKGTLIHWFWKCKLIKLLWKSV